MINNISKKIVEAVNDQCVNLLRITGISKAELNKNNYADLGDVLKKYKYDIEKTKISGQDKYTLKFNDIPIACFTVEITFNLKDYANYKIVISPIQML